MILAKKIKVKKFSVFKYSFFCFLFYMIITANTALKAFWLNFKRIVSRDRMGTFLAYSALSFPFLERECFFPNFIKRGSLPLGPTSGMEGEICFAGFHPS
jgi:hypothetical protein